MRLMHCSDIHITARYHRLPPWKLGWRRIPALAELYLRGRARLHAESAQVVRRLTAEAHAAGVDHLLVSGDLTGYALEEEFDGARAALEPWSSDPRRCTVIEGNHDTYVPEALKERRFARRFEHLMRSDCPEYAVDGIYPFVKWVGSELAVVGLLSARVPALPGFSFGWLGEPQLSALARLLKDPRLEGRAIAVMVHHAPLNAAGHPDKALHRLQDADQLMSLLPGSRFAVFHGHIHRRYHHPATASRPHLVGAGSSTQLGRRGYWLAEVKGGSFVDFRCCSLE